MTSAYRSFLRRAWIPVLGLCAGVASAGSVSSELQAMMDAAPATQRIPVMIPMTAQLDPKDLAGTLEDESERLAVVVEGLKTQALATQNAHGCGQVGLLDQLAAAGVAKATNIQRLWAINAVAVEATKDVIASAALRNNVGELGYAGNRTIEDPGGTASTPQWNVTKVRAPEAWAIGATGAGGLVASIDTGGNASHPILSANLLRDASNNPVWHDAVTPGSAPNDPDGHGTHLLGIAVGKSGYGVAPDAKWLACRAFVRNGAMLETTAARMLECAQWLLNPDHPDVTDAGAPDASHVPDAVMADLVISAAGFCDPFLQNIVRVWRAAGIVPVFSVGDDPIAAPVGAVPSPANDPLVFSVGAADQSDVILTTTYRGIAFCHTPIEEDGTAPHLVAPGVNVTSAWTGTTYATRSGSDVASAHVAGAVALLRGARPDTRKVPVDVLAAALERTAAPVASGQKRLDVYSAVTLEDAEFVDQLPPPMSMVTGEYKPVTVTFHNTGLMTWTTGQYELRDVNANPAWGILSVPLPQVDGGVLPDDEVDTSFTVRAPMTPGTYQFRWRMCHVGGACVGDLSDPVNVTVVGYDAASYVNQAVECKPPGQTGNAVVIYHNSGTTTWTNPSYTVNRLVNYGPFSMPITVPASGVVPPGGDAWFSSTFVSPFPAGYYFFQARPKNGATPFGDTSPVILMDTNDCSPKSSTVNTPPVHTELRVGQVWPLQLTFTNTGQATWRAGYCVRLTQGSWGAAAAQACITGGTQILPGQSWTTPPINVVAPNNPGRWAIAYQMYTDDNYAFGQTWSGTIGIPRDHQGSVEWSSLQGTYNWFYRYYSNADAGWKKMSWAGDHWHGAQSYQDIYQTSMHPGGTQAAGRFWKSPIDGWVRASGTLWDTNSSCGDGVTFRLRRNSSLIFEWQFNNGFGATYFQQDIWVNKDDTVRFTVRPRGNNYCDGTALDPLVQVLPPAAPATGPAPSEGYAVGNLVIELGGD